MEFFDSREADTAQEILKPRVGEPAFVSDHSSQDPRELESSFGHWNAHLEEDGRLVPDIARL